jgi:hypothetical protein
VREGAAPGEVGSDPRRGFGPRVRRREPVGFVWHQGFKSPAAVIPLCLSLSIPVSEDRGVCRRVHPPVYTVECVSACALRVCISGLMSIKSSLPGSGCVDVRLCLGVRVCVGVWFCVSVSVSVCMSVSVCVGGGVRFVAVSVRACVGCLCVYVCRMFVCVCL